MRSLILMFLVLLASLSQAGQNNGLPTVQKRLFVSFSMPDLLLRQSFEAAERLGVTVVLNGFFHNSMAETAKKLTRLTHQYPGLGIQIDPTAFEDFKIHSVPAVLVSCGQDFDVVFGNLNLDDALSLINRRGDLKGRVL